MNNLNEIAFKQIKDNYYWGCYGPFEVIVDINDGYINATHLCGLAEAEHKKSRKFNDWARLGSSGDILGEVQACTGFPTHVLLRTPKGLPNELRGTYAHPKLIPHIASWASVKFAIMVSDIVNAHLVRDYKEKIRTKDTKIDELCAMVKKQNETISDIKQQNIDIRGQNIEMMEKNVEQSRRIDEQSRQIFELLGYARETKSTLEVISNKNDQLLTEIRETSIETDVLNHQIKSATESIEIIMENKTVPVKPAKSQYSRVYGKKGDPGLYYFVRGQKVNADKTAATIRKDGYDDLIYNKKDPNPFNSFNNMKELLDEGAKDILKMKRTRGSYNFRDAKKEFGYYKGNYICCSRKRLNDLLAQIDAQRDAFDM